MGNPQNLPFRPPLAGSPRALSTSGPFPLDTCPPEVATRRAAILLASYRKGDAEDPEIYSGAVASVLAAYPLAVAYRVTDPRTGLAGRMKFLPTVEEVRSACEAEMGPARAAEELARRRAHTAAVLSGHKAPVGSPEHQRVVAGFARLSAVCPTPELARYRDRMRPEAGGEGALP
jgi:hypothetical protein